MAVAQMTLGEIAELLGGEVRGDPAAVIQTLAPIDQAGPEAITFISNQKYVGAIKHTRAGGVLVDPNVAQLGAPEGTGLVVLDDPYMGFARLLTHWTDAGPRAITGVSERAFVHPTATLGEGVNVHEFAWIGPNATVGARCDILPGAYVGANATIGDDTHLGPNCVVHHDCRVGARCKIYAGAAIGSDGFGFAPDRATGLHFKIPQIGIAVIEDDVEIGANVTVDRAVMGETRVGQGTKIDNLVQIGHNAQVGRGCFVVSQVGISGTTKVGNGVTIAGQAGLAGHITVGDGAQIGAQAGIHANVAPGGKMIGSPAMDGSVGRKALATIRRLPELRKQLADLERRIAELEQPAD